MTKQETITELTTCIGELEAVLGRLRLAIPIREDQEAAFSIYLVEMAIQQLQSHASGLMREVQAKS